MKNKRILNVVDFIGAVFFGVAWHFGFEALVITMLFTGIGMIYSRT